MEKVEVKKSGIDKDVLDIMTQDDVLSAIENERELRRFELNCFCEFLSEIKELRKEFDEFMQMISVCSADKIGKFFTELQKNVDKEEKLIELQDKIEKSHKKSKKK